MLDGLEGSIKYLKRIWDSMDENSPRAIMEAKNKSRSNRHQYNINQSTSHKQAKFLL
jgi:hypothetical protein